MKPDSRFVGQSRAFWANVRLISERVGYTERSTRRIKVPTLAEMHGALNTLGLGSDHLFSSTGNPTPMGQILGDYFARRADLLNSQVEPNLMDAVAARREFDHLRRTLKPTCPLPLNKQKGKKRAPAYLTGIVNMLIEANADGSPCDFDPRALTTVTHAGAPLRTLSRRVDGCFPSTVNPVAVWEIKEYYHTTTFGSRVADGVYEQGDRI